MYVCVCGGGGGGGWEDCTVPVLWIFCMQQYRESELLRLFSEGAGILLIAIYSLPATSPSTTTVMLRYNRGLGYTSNITKNSVSI